MFRPNKKGDVDVGKLLLVIGALGGGFMLFATYVLEWDVKGFFSGLFGGGGGPVGGASAGTGGASGGGMSGWIIPIVLIVVVLYFIRSWRKGKKDAGGDDDDEEGEISIITGRVTDNDGNGRESEIDFHASRRSRWDIKAKSKLPNGDYKRVSGFFNFRGKTPLKEVERSKLVLKTGTSYSIKIKPEHRHLYADWKMILDGTAKPVSENSFKPSESAHTIDFKLLSQAQIDAENQAAPPPGQAAPPPGQAAPPPGQALPQGQQPPVAAGAGGVLAGNLGLGAAAPNRRRRGLRNIR